MNLNNRTIDEDKETCKRLTEIALNFKEFMKENDPLYESKVIVSTTYDPDEGLYKIGIFSSRNGFNSGEYFKNIFETKDGIEKLGDFCRNNGVAFIEY